MLFCELLFWLWCSGLSSAWAAARAACQAFRPAHPCALCRNVYSVFLFFGVCHFIHKKSPEGLLRFILVASQRWAQYFARTWCPLRSQLTQPPLPPSCLCASVGFARALLPPLPPPWWVRVTMVAARDFDGWLHVASCLLPCWMPPPCARSICGAASIFRL